MKKFALCALALFIMTASYAQERVVSVNSSSSASPNAGFNWSNTSFDFGKTKAGLPVSYEFRFTNAGMAPLVISSVKASCGCTVTAYTKEPVEKGGSGFVRATYDAAKPGKYSKTVTVYANTVEGMVLLTIKGEITE